MQEYWWLDDFGIPALHAQGFTGKGIKIAVLDTGVCLAHPSLKLDKNLLHDVTGSPSGVNDVRGHGTHCTGIIMATAYGGIEALGIAPDAEIYICKITHDTYGDDNTYLTAAIEWAIAQNVDIVSISNGFPSDMDSNVEQAITNGVKMGMLFVCAAGNKTPGYPDNHIYYPARYDASISVGGIDQNRDPIASSILTNETKIFAPGASIYSTYLNNGYTRLSGSSQATPFVAATSALFIEQQRRNNPAYKASQVTPLLLGEADAFQYGKIINPLLLIKKVNP